MQKIAGITGSVLLLAGLLNSTTAEAFFGNMMNPSRWFGGDRDYGDYYYDGPPPGYGPGYYAAPPAYGAPGYAPPPVYAAPAYGHAPPAQSAPANTGSAASDEIRQLKKRIEQLEQERESASSARQADTYGNPAGTFPVAPPASHSGYSAPASGQPAAAAAGRPALPTPQAAPVQAAGQPGQQPSPPAVEWRPSGYIHPAMQP